MNISTMKILFKVILYLKKMNSPNLILHVHDNVSVFMTYVYHGWDSNTQPSACETKALTDFATTALRVKLRFWQTLNAV